MKQISSPIRILSRMMANITSLRMISFQLTSLLFLLFIAIQALAYHDPIEDFGFNNLNNLTNSPFTATPPALVILMSYSDVGFRSAHTPDFYRKLLFHVGFLGKVAGAGGMIHAQSAGVLDEFGLTNQYWFYNAGILGPFLHPDNPDTPGDEREFLCAFGENKAGEPTPPVGPPGKGSIPAECGTWEWNSNKNTWINVSQQAWRANAIKEAAKAGFDFSGFDTNPRSAGLIRNDELLIIAIGAGPNEKVNDGGQSMGTTPNIVPVSDSLGVNVDVPGIAEDAGAATIAHEIVHYIQNQGDGAFDIYGISCLNCWFSLMSGTRTGTVDNRRTVNLDPFSKMKQGWLRPEILHTSDTACLSLKPVDTLFSPGDEPLAYILYDPRVGPQEYFILEYREPLALIGLLYDGDPFITGTTGVPDRGLAIWYVRIGKDQLPLDIKARDGSTYPNNNPKWEKTVFLVPPGRDQTPALWGKPLGNNGLWDESNGAAQPPWLVFEQNALTKAFPSGLNISVVAQRTSPYELIVRIGDATCEGIPPVMAPLSPVRVADGVERWIHKDFILERKTPDPAPANETFDVIWSLTPIKDILGKIQINDQLPKNFLINSQNGPSVIFEGPIPAGQTVSGSYQVEQGGPGGGAKVSSELIVTSLGIDQQPERIPFEWFISLEITTIATHNSLDDDLDDVLLFEDFCPFENASDFDVDKDGCIDSFNGLVDVVVKLVSEEVITTTMENSLLSKVGNAENSVGKENVCAAINQLEAFKSQVDAQTGKKILVDAASQVKDYADSVALYLLSQLPNGEACS